MKILVIRFSSIGDIVLTTPVIRCLKKQLPGCELHYATKKEYASILHDNPYVDKLHELEGDLDGLTAKLKAEKFDHIIDLHANLRTVRMRMALRAEWSSFHKLNIEKWLFVNLKVNRLPDVHIVHRYMETVAHLGVRYDGAGLDFFIGADDEARLLQLLPDNFKNGYVCLVPGAKFATKSIPVEKAVEIVKNIPKPVMILGGPAEAETAKQIIALSGRQDVIHYCGKFPLQQSAAALKHAQAAITADTGMMHIAAALDKKIVSVWGNTVPEFGMYPFLPDNSQNPSAIMEVKGLPCRPCSKIGYDKCPKGHFKCMREQDAVSIAGAVSGS